MRIRSFTLEYFAQALLLLMLAVAVSPCYSQPVTTWIDTSSSGDWFDSQNWDNGIPNAAGVVAQLTGTTGNSIQLGQQATVGQLILMGPEQSNVVGSGPLLFGRPGADAALIRLTPPASVGAINSPISIAASEQLSVDVAEFTSLLLGGAIVSSAGDITKIGRGTLSLTGASPTWAGQLVVTSGQVNITNASA